MDTRISWITECLSLLDNGRRDYPVKKVPLLLPKIINYLEGAKSYSHLRDKVRFATKVCAYLSKCN